MEAEQPIKPEERKDQGKPLVLVVDGRSLHLKLLELLADHINMTAQLTSSCADALELLRMFSFDVVLMDCRMPIVDGCECTKRIRALNEKTRNIPIIAVTANLQTSNRIACRDAGMNDFLGKPFTLQELHDKLCYWLEKKVED